MKFQLGVTIASLTCLAADAQRTVTHNTLLWGAFAGTVQLNRHWSINSDVQVRTADWADRWLLYAARTGITCFVTPKVSVAAGMAIFRTAVYDKTRLLFFKNEWRPWQEAGHTDTARNGMVFFQRIRTEERFQQQQAGTTRLRDYQYVLRVRLRLDVTIPVSRETALLAGDEIFVNPGNAGTRNFFDQNRTYIGCNFKSGYRGMLQGMYVKIFQWHSTTSILDDQDVIRLNYIQKFKYGHRRTQTVVHG